MRPSALTMVLPRCYPFGWAARPGGRLRGRRLPAKAEVEFSIFTGVALTQDSDLDLHQRAGTDLTFHDVSFEGRDFSAPPYYGIRALWFPSETSHWGFGAEFFHMKMYAQTDDTVKVTGRRDGWE